MNARKYDGGVFFNKMKAFLVYIQLLPDIKWTSKKVCTVGDGFTHKMEYNDVHFTEILMYFSEVLQKEDLRQDLRRSLKSLTSGTSLSSQLRTKWKLSMSSAIRTTACSIYKLCKDFKDRRKVIYEKNYKTLGNKI